MLEIKIGNSLEVPANSSRLFSNRDDAIRQSTAEVQLVCDEKYPFVYNVKFDPSLIQYDFNYCTTDKFHLKDTVAYLSDLAEELPSYSSIIEIGCGQGEFVKYLRRLGFNSFGFDPTLKNSSEYLFQTLWSTANQDLCASINYLKNPLYIMRCVLPHIPNPFDFLDSILELNSESRVLIEFQRREFIIYNNMWTQISHDHVNIFSIGDFAERFEILDSGEFANCEWAYVLLKKGTTINSKVDYFSEYIEFEKVFRVRDFEIESLAELKSPIAIYGAAGKGIVFGFSLMNSKFVGGAR